MATHDYNLANQDGASFRSDLNNALAAIVSNNSSSTAPATTFAHQIWVDTTANVIKQRNAANDAWIELWRIDGGFNAKTFSSNVTLNAQSDLRFADSDSSNWVAFQAPATVASNVTWTLPSADGTADQALVTNGSGTLSWADSGGGDNITEGNTSAEVVDTGSDGHFKVVTEGTEALRVDPSQRLLVGTTSLREVTPFGGAAFTTQIHNLCERTGNPGPAGITLCTNYTDYPQVGSALVFARTRSTSTGGNTSVASGDNLGTITFAGADGTDINSSAAKIYAEVDGTPGSNDMPGRLVFSTTADGASSPTERMRLDSSGRLLLGATSSTNASSNCKLVVNTNSASVRLEGTAGYALDSVYTTVPASGDDLGLIGFKAYTTGTTEAYGAYIMGEADAAWSSGSAPGRITFYTTPSGSTSPTERMRIDANGRVRINRTSGLYTEQFLVESNTQTVVPMTVSNTDTDNSAEYSIIFRRDTSLVGSIQTTLSATNYVTSSDHRLKENVVPLVGAIDRVNQLQVHRFNFIADPDTTVDGFIAHEAQAVVPEAVTGTHDEVDDEGNPVYQGIDQSKLVPLLTAALQEALAKIETLETRLTALENA